MKLFIKTIFTMLYVLFVVSTLLYASINGFFTVLENILISMLFGGSIKVVVDWLIKEEIYKWT